MGSISKYITGIGQVTAIILFGLLELVLLVTLYITFQEYPGYSIAIGLTLVIIIVAPYKFGKHVAIVSYNRKLIRKGVWIRTTKDITIKTDTSKFTMYSQTFAFIFKINSNKTYDLLIPWPDASSHRVLRQCSEYRYVEIASLEEVDEEGKRFALKALQEGLS